MRPRAFGLVFLLILLQVSLSVKAGLIPIVDPTSNCSGHGTYLKESGVCMCQYAYSGRQCQSTSMFSGCLLKYECYNCQDYQCPENALYLPYHTGFKTVQSCDSVTSTYTADSDETVTITLHNTCRNITSFCYQVCGCPSGIAYMASNCFRTELINNFGFFILLMAILTVISTLFEFGVHGIERWLKKTDQKAVLGIIQTFKSELTLIGLIGLVLYTASSSEAFEHGISALGGKEDIIEAVHFLVFFLIVGYFFTLALCFVLTKLFLRRKLRNHEEIFQDARKAAFRGENYEETKLDAVKAHNMNGCLKKSFYREYNAYRIYFMKSLKNEYSEEDLMFFRFDEYVALCANDLIGRISGGTWLAWIFFAWNFFVDVYMQNWLVYVSRALLNIFFLAAGLVNSGAKDRIMFQLKKQADELKTKDENQVLIAEEQSPTTESLNQTVKIIVTVNQMVLWFGLTHIFTSAFGMRSISWIIMLIALLLMFAVYAALIFWWLPTVAGAVYNGSNINKNYVKEVMKRFPQVDKQVLIDQYRTNNNGQLPNINDVFVDEQAA